MRRLIVALTALLPFTAAPAAAQDFVDDLTEMEAVWYRKAAEQGLALAQYLVGSMYANGAVGFTRNAVRAAYWYGRAAEQGHVEAQFSLGFMYVNGKGVPEDNAQAATWFRRAAEQGDARSQALLGGMYTQGQGVPKDDVQAYAWFSIAAAQGNAAAKKGKDIVAGRMTDEQIAKAQQLSRDFWDEYVEPFEKD